MSYRLNQNLFTRRIEQLTALEAATWDRLVLANIELQRAFLSRTYIAAVAKTSGDVIVLVGYAAGAPIFFLPLQRQSGVLGHFGVFEIVGGVMTDYFGIIAENGVKVTIPAMLNATKGVVNAVVFTHLDQSQEYFGLHADEYRTGLRTLLDEPPNEYWANLRKTDKKLVYDTERREKKLVGEFGPITFEWSSSQPESDLAWLVESKKLQYSRTGKEQAPLFNKANVALLTNLLQAREKCCSGQLSVLRCGDDVVAAHFGLRCREMLHVWFPVYDQKFANHSPGRILFKHMFAAGAEHGITVFDRGEGDNQAKRDFANEEHRFGRGLWFSPSVGGQLAQLAQRIAWRIRR
jgi:CelD/BcsL family acetyltransferase involved in cellulose biosynthesis